MTSPAPALRVVLPCDESEFRRRLADPIAENGLFVPNARERPPGSTLRLRLELRDGAAVSGEAIVLGGGSTARPGVLVRFVRLDADGIQLEIAAPPEPGPPPREAEPPTLQSSLFADADDLPPPTVSTPIEVRVKPVVLRLRAPPDEPLVPPRGGRR